MVNVALPAIERDFDIGLVGEQWIVLSYALALAVTFLPGGALGDRLGRRNVFVAGCIGFAVASALCGAAPNQGVLIAGRILQGIAGGLVTPTSLGLLRATYGAESGPAIGHWSAWTGIATVLGPPAGGALVEWASWRWIFFINLPIAALAAGFALMAGEDEEEELMTTPLDVVGSVLAALSLGTLTYALVEAGQGGFGRAIVLVPFVVGVLALTLFFLWEHHTEEPLLEPALMRNRNFAFGNLETLVVYGGLYASSFLVVLYLQSLGFSAFTTGLLTMPMSVVLFLGAARGGRFADRVGPSLPLTIGPLLLAAGILLYFLVRPGSGWGWALPGAIVFGLGLCFLVAPITNVVLQAAPEEQSGIAAGVSVTTARVGALFAIALAGLLAAHFFHDNAGTKHATPLARNQPPVLQRASEDGFRAGMLFSAGLAVLGAGIAILGISDRQARADRDRSAAAT